MPKSKLRPHSAYCREAAMLLGLLIRQQRIEISMTAKELSERAGISRGLLLRIEKGDLGCSIGAVFEAASKAGLVHMAFWTDSTSQTGTMLEAILDCMVRARNGHERTEAP